MFSNLEPRPDETAPAHNLELVGAIRHPASGIRHPIVLCLTEARGPISAATSPPLPLW
jgi:hypothetical protein